MWSRVESFCLRVSLIDILLLKKGFLLGLSVNIGTAEQGRVNGGIMIE